MSETVLFAIGSLVFAMTVYGTVMAGGLWFGRLQEEQIEETPPDTQGS